MAKFVAMGIDGIEPEEYGPDEGSVICGNPRFRLWSLDEAKGPILRDLGGHTGQVAL
jgi:uncharacterized protein